MSYNVSFQQFNHLLSENGYLTNEQESIKYYTSLIGDRKGAILSGKAGTGKTFLPETLSKMFNAELFFYQCFPNTRQDDLITKPLPTEETKSGIKLYDSVLPLALRHVQTGNDNKAIILLDEWDKTALDADAFLLDFLQSYRINYNGIELELTQTERERIAIFLTSNDVREISEPLERRLPYISFNLLSPAKVCEALIDKASKRGIDINAENFKNYLNISIELYIRWLHIGIEKPLTIQELDEFINVLMSVGTNHLPILIMQYLAKNTDNFQMLNTAMVFDLDDIKKSLAKKNIDVNVNTSFKEVNKENIVQDLTKAIQSNQTERKDSEAVDLINIDIDLKQFMPNGVKVVNDDDLKELNKVGKGFIKYSNNCINLMNEYASYFTNNKTDLFEVITHANLSKIVLNKPLNYDIMKKAYASVSNNNSGFDLIGEVSIERNEVNNDTFVNWLIVNNAKSFDALNLIEDDVYTYYIADFGTNKLHIRYDYDEETDLGKVTLIINATDLHNVLFKLTDLSFNVNVDIYDSFLSQNKTTFNQVKIDNDKVIDCTIEKKDYGYTMQFRMNSQLESFFKTCKVTNFYSNGIEVKLGGLTNNSTITAFTNNDTQQIIVRGSQFDIVDMNYEKKRLCKFYQDFIYMLTQAFAQ